MVALDFFSERKVSNRLVAIKQLLNAAKSEQADIIHEIEIVSRFENPNVVTYYHHFMKRMFYFCNGILLRRQFKR
jgi:serine/threonine protein kinase